MFDPVSWIGIPPTNRHGEFQKLSTIYGTAAAAGAGLICLHRSVL